MAKLQGPFLSAGHDGFTAREAGGVPKLFNLSTNPLEDDAKPTVKSWIVGPVLKMVCGFEQSVKVNPLIPMGSPDPYEPPH